MRLQLDPSGKFKNLLHALQASLLILSLLLTIALFTRPGSSSPGVFYFFTLCWLTIPIIVYLVMVPMWSRARRFSNVYAFAILDGASILLWLTAWASTASYVASGKGRGDDTKKTGCENFKFGSPGRCKLSTGITVLGVFIMLAFCATAFFSFRALMEYKRTGMMPLHTSGSKYTAQAQNDAEFAQQTQEAFSSNMRSDEFDEPEADARQGGYAYQEQHDEGRYTPIYHEREDDDHHDLAEMQATQPASALGQHGLGTSSNLNYDTSYSGAHGQHSPTLSPDEDARADHRPYGR